MLSAICAAGTTGEAYNEREDNVAQVALLAGHCAASLLLLLLLLLLLRWVGRLTLLRLALLRRGALHLGDYKGMRAASWGT
jgi:hypothetical protein